MDKNILKQQIIQNNPFNRAFKNGPRQKKIIFQFLLKIRIVVNHKYRQKNHEENAEKRVIVGKGFIFSFIIVIKSVKYSLFCWLLRQN